ncbi:ABC transporter substrate-binding protein [Nitrogeniibacter mangrovi]|uniref:ABC transporter substrate-binding protein n=1 Tax=Nitrogeniibacter mangrovi TaxID=2016596 RepID=A0A6C1B5S0_9RHOO|nr:ABC transporter substrate-binding protein [Nitrogeniibacter mangrovi]QID18783.1 ABC transporter substrate-binding protein [Nitrogeniibacter mangrovi]
MIKLIRSLLLGLCLLAGASAFAAPAPDELVKNVSDEVLQIVRADPAIQRGDTSRAVELVEEKVLPHFDFRLMTALAVGRDWRQATPDQRDKLVAAFRTLLVRTYSNALTQYRDQVIDFKPLRAKPEDTDVTVRSEVRQPGAKPVDIDYSLEKQGDDWKVYDVAVAGVSLVTNYRSSFASQIHQKGIDGLIASLEAKNAELASKVQ